MAAFGLLHPQRPVRLAVYPQLCNAVGVLDYQSLSSGHGILIVWAQEDVPRLVTDFWIPDDDGIARRASHLHSCRSSQLDGRHVHDVDVNGAKRLAEELRLAPARAPRTALWLKEWELVAAQLRTGTGGLAPDERG